jgi:C-terminal processing protease CtpA/Prc
VTLERGPGGFGFTIKANAAPGPLTVGKVTDGGAAEQDGQVHPGDRIVSINGQNTRETTKSEA